MILKFFLFILALTLQAFALHCEPISIRIEKRQDFEILDQFFRLQFSEEEYGYVLEGAKPISVREFYPLSLFPNSKDLKLAEKEFIDGILVREAILVWQRICPNQKNFVLKGTYFKKSDSASPQLEVQFINVTKLREVIGKNIDLFRFTLGPAINTEQLVSKIAYSEEPLVEILQGDSTLTGIVLGFGAYNSVMGGRVDTIFSQVFSKDCAPFSPKALVINGKKEHSLSFVTPERYGAYYLEYAGGDDTFFKNSSSKQSLDLSDVEKELISLDKLHEPLPVSLMEKPAFVFSAYKGNNNRPFFSQLQQTQKRLQTLLNKSDFLGRILEKIGGKKPHILCDKVPYSGTLFALLNKNISEKNWSAILREVENRFEDKKSRAAFIEAFSHPSQSSREAPTMLGASKATLEGLKKALHGLDLANAHFEALSKDDTLQMIVPGQLYFKTTLSSSGKELKGANRIRIGYVIEDLEGNILFANHDTWIIPSETISGFAHGIQGMRISERRTLFVHPALAYGALTTLPPCRELVMKLHLIDVDETIKGELPPLTPIDLNWLKNPAFLRALEESVDQLPRFTGAFYRDFLDKIEGLDKKAIISGL